MPGPVGGPGPMWKRAIWLFISCCIALAVWNGVVGGDPSTLYERLQHKSEEVRKDAEDLGKKIDNNIKKGAPNDTGKTTGKPAPKGNGN